MRRAGTLVTLALVAACWETPASPPPIGYENDIDTCTDGRDNDRDGQVDCIDTDCVAFSLCNEGFSLVPPNQPDEDDFDLCTNGIDDDDDGNFDCGDRSCGSIAEVCCSTEFTDAACSNGIDDDANGFTDCRDFGCRQGLFVTVCNAEADCADGADNDGDGRTDCLDTDCARDDVCRGPYESDCGNGEDEDGDGAIDCDDSDCVGVGTCVTPEDTVAACMDGLDNDGNGFVDCDDFGCSRSTDPDVLELCMVEGEPEDTVAACMDGEDNDGNGFVDCNDFGCLRSSDPTIVEYCVDRLEIGFAKCIDRIDNDGNGFVDCNDFSCRASAEFLDSAMTRVISPCVESGTTPDTISAIRELTPFPDDVAAQNARLNCSDGMDNDADGFVDCGDWDCNWNPLIPGFCQERTGFLICR